MTSAAITLRANNLVQYEKFLDDLRDVAHLDAYTILQQDVGLLEIVFELNLTWPPDLPGG